MHKGSGTAVPEISDHDDFDALVKEVAV